MSRLVGGVGITGFYGASATLTDGFPRLYPPSPEAVAGDEGAVGPPEPVTAAPPTECEPTLVDVYNSQQGRADGIAAWLAMPISQGLTLLNLFRKEVEEAAARAQREQALASIRNRRR